MQWISRLRWLGIAAVFLFGITLCHAHNIGVSYASIDVFSDQVRWLIRVPIPELDLLLDLDSNHDGKVDAAELQQHESRLRNYFAAHIQVARPDPVSKYEAAIAPEVGTFSLWYDSGNHPFAETQITFASPSGAYSFRCDLLQDVVSGHQTLATIHNGGKTEQFAFQAGTSYEVLKSSRLQRAVQFVRMGVLHILTGYDHIAFLIGLMLIGGSFRSLLKIVTSFTVAHSLTLALATLNLVTLPSRLVESGIALSIMYIALENLFFQSFDRRWIVTFFFGLVHGFGFATALRELALSRSDLGAALFLFNFGVEIGQVCIIALFLPLIWLSANRRYTAVLVKAASCAIFLFGSTWLYQRILGR